MATHSVEVYSLSHFGVLDPTSGAEPVSGNLFGVRNATMAVDITKTDNTGDNAILSSWYDFNFVTLTVTSGFISASLIEQITKSPVKDYATAAAYTANTPVDRASATYATDLAAAVGNPQHVWEQDLWRQDALVTSPWPVIARAPSRDNAGVVRLHDFILYKVIFSPIQFNGPTYRAILESSFTAQGFMSSVNEKGTSLGTLPDGRPIQAAGRMINRPG